MIKTPPRRSQTDRTRATTEALLRAAERMFGDTGYDATSLDDVAARAGVTKGALYHHFPEGKAALFEAVVLRLQDRLIGALDAAAQSAEGLAGLKQVLNAYFVIATDERFHRITSLDAPAVFGPDKWREIEYSHALRHIRGSIELVLSGTAAATGAKTMLAQAFFGALNETTFAVVAAKNRAAARSLAVDTIATIVEGAYTVLLRRAAG
jgi:AcrR family transcriptional regulator